MHHAIEARRRRLKNLGAPEEYDDLLLKSYEIQNLSIIKEKENKETKKQ